MITFTPRHSAMALAACAALLAIPTVAGAATASTTFIVQASVVASCRVSGPTLDFGAYDPSLGTPLDGSTTLSVYCTKTTPFTVALNTGINAGSYTTGRVMKSAALDSLTYNLYTTAARTSVWGDGTASSITTSGTGTGAATAVALTVYGRIPSQPTAIPATSYTDLITVTVTY